MDNIGICNPFNIVPFMVKPVFEDEEGNLCLGYIYDKETKEYSPYIKGFSRVSNEYMKYVERLSDCMVNSDALNKEFYSVGELAPCGIELDNGIVYVNDMYRYLEFLREYKNEIAFSFEFKGDLLKNIEDEINFIEPLVIKYKQDRKNKVYQDSLEMEKLIKKAEDFEKKLIKIIEENK